MALDKMLMKLAARPKVLERDTGRLLVGLPVLKQVPDSFHKLAEYLPRLCRLRDGIESADLDFSSGEIEIAFEPEKIREKEVLYYLEMLILFLWRKRHEFSGLKKKKIAAFISDLEEELRSEIEG